MGLCTVDTYVQRHSKILPVLSDWTERHASTIVRQRQQNIWATTAQKSNPMVSALSTCRSAHSSQKHDKAFCAEQSIYKYISTLHTETQCHLMENTTSTDSLQKRYHLHTDRITLTMMTTERIAKPLNKRHKHCALRLV